MTAVADTAPGSPAPVFKSWQEFPTWLPPMLVKELRQGLRSRGFVGVFVLLQSILLITFFFVVGEGGNLASSGINVVFWGIIGGLLLLAFPLRGLTGLSAEIDGHKGDLLVLTPLTAWRIVTGKWVSLVAQGALITVSLLPYGVMRYFLGEVDLLSDLAVGATIFAIGAVLTGFTLWASGWPKALRALPAIACIPGFLLVIAAVESAMRMGPVYAARGTPFGFLFLLFGPVAGIRIAFIFALALFEGALFLVFCLNQAARRLAPPAENHASLNRVLALLLLYPILFVAWFGVPGAWLAQFAVSGLGIFAICALEMATVAEPMRVQVRRWMDAPAWCRPLGRLLLPGWQSAAGFALLPCGFAFALAFSFDPLGNPWFELPLFLWCLILSWATLVFPVVFLSLFGARPRLVAAGFWIIQGALGIVSLFSANWEINARTPRGLALLDSFFQMLPGVSLWRTLPWIYNLGHHATVFGASFSGSSRDLHGLTPAILMGQGVMVVATVMLYFRQSRPYWALVRERSAGPAVPPPAPSAP